MKYWPVKKFLNKWNNEVTGPACWSMKNFGQTLYIVCHGWSTQSKYAFSSVVQACHVNGVRVRSLVERRVSDAAVSAMQYRPLRTLLHMQTCPGLCKNRPADMYMTEHICARVSERACTEPMYNFVPHEYSRILWLQLIPKGRTFPRSFMTCTYS